MGQAVRAVCAFCNGLRPEPPGVQQFMVLGQQAWLHLQCRAGYTKSQEMKQEDMREQTRA